MHRIHVHLPGFLIELRAQVFFRLIILASRDHHRVFNRRHHDFRLNVLLAAEHLYLLVKQIRHFSFLRFRRQNSTTKFALRMPSSGSSTTRASRPFSSIRTFPFTNPPSPPSKNFPSPTPSPPATS